MRAIDEQIYTPGEIDGIFRKLCNREWKEDGWSIKVIPAKKAESACLVQTKDGWVVRMATYEDRERYQLRLGVRKGQAKFWRVIHEGVSIRDVVEWHWRITVSAKQVEARHEAEAMQAAEDRQRTLNRQKEILESRIKNREGVKR